MNQLGRSNEKDGIFNFFLNEPMNVRKIIGHHMDEADELCKRVAFMSNGRIVAIDTPFTITLK